MAKRIFELPKAHELTKEQRRAIRLPDKGQHLVFGGPGTGKSVVALIRMQKNSALNNTTFLTYNHVLNHANKALVGNQLDENMNTALSWLYQLHWKLSDNEYMPQTKNYQPNYEILCDKFDRYKVDMRDLGLIIDEGQDLPVLWYEAVQKLNIQNFFIVADQNQQITTENSNHDELQDVLGLNKEQIVYLKENWRNTTPIAAFANYFYTDKASPLPTVPNKPSTYIPILYEFSLLNDAIDLVWKAYQRDSSKLIGVIVCTDSKRIDWYNKLSAKADKNKLSDKIISTYEHNQADKVNINFAEGGFVILNDKSVKGIEFDEVYIILDGFPTSNSDVDYLKKRMYVMATRARERLFLLKNSIQASLLEKILPEPEETIEIDLDGSKIQIELLKRIKI